MRFSSPRSLFRLLQSLACSQFSKNLWKMFFVDHRKKNEAKNELIGLFNLWNDDKIPPTVLFSFPIFCCCSSSAEFQTKTKRMEERKLFYQSKHYLDSSCCDRLNSHHRRHRYLRRRRRCSHCHFQEYYPAIPAGNSTKSHRHLQSNHLNCDDHRVCEYECVRCWDKDKNNEIFE